MSDPLSLFGSLSQSDTTKRTLCQGATVLRGFARSFETALLAELADVTVKAPFRRMVTPGGFRMSVAMTNCGALGWITDRSGYRYDRVDPETGRVWPSMPGTFLALATSAAAEAGFGEFFPDACLINRYEPEARLSLHQDKNEEDFGQPIVSVSLGVSAIFLFGGLQRSDRTQRIQVEHGDVIVWGGPARLHYHGVMPLREDFHPLTGAYRFNLTFRRAA